MISAQIAPSYAAAAPSPQETWEHARRLVFRYGWNSVAYQILNPGIQHWFAPNGDAVIGYVRAAGYRVVAGSPIARAEDLAAVASTFSHAAHRAGQRVCYFGVQDRFVSAMAAQPPMARLLIGAQPVWDPHGWTEILAHKASLRAQIARARNKAVTISPWPTEKASTHTELRRCLAEWLQERHLPSMHFLVEPDTFGHLHDRYVWVACREQQVIGFLVASPIPQRRGWLVEQLVRCHAAPNGTAELLVDAAMRHFAANDIDYVTLGLSPLACHTPWAATPQPAWISALLAMLRVYGQRFYNFSGLDAFKSKLQPHLWEPVYAMSNQRHFTPHTFYAIIGAFGGTSPLRYLSRALWRVVRGM